MFKCYDTKFSATVAHFCIKLRQCQVKPQGLGKTGDGE